LQHARIAAIKHNYTESTATVFSVLGCFILLAVSQLI